MDATILNLLLQSYKSIAEDIFGKELTVSNTALYNEQKYDGVIITVGITGDLQGQVSSVLSEELCAKFASMMMGSEVGFDEMAKSAISELSNMVMGRATIMLAEKGIKTDITPPLLYTGENIRIDVMNAKTIEVKTSVGIIIVVNIK